MTLKRTEGIVFKPMPVVTAAPERKPARAKVWADAGEPRCELCGHVVIAHHCKRICTHCGFMIGCSEGI